MSTANTPATGPHRWADFIGLPDGDRRELIDGQLVEIEVPTKLHEYVVTYLAAALFTWSRTHGGTALASGYKVRIDDARGVMPDVQFYRRGHGPTGEKGLEEGAPDLAVEVVSPSSGRHDRVIKLNWYARIGTPEYWIVDPKCRTLERLVLEGRHYIVAAALDETMTFEPDSFSGLAVELGDLFTLPE